jgi:hypothetical protein
LRPVKFFFGINEHRKAFAKVSRKFHTISSPRRVIESTLIASTPIDIPLFCGHPI